MGVLKEIRTMRAWRQILRVLLVVGLIPTVAAAGLSPQLCACDAVPAPSGCPCCEARESSCCCGKSGRSHDGTAVESPCCEQDDAGEPSDGSLAVECRCGGPTPVPAAPSVPAVELVDLTAVSVPVVAPAPRPPVTASAERARSAALPPRDLPTTFCALLI